MRFYMYVHALQLHILSPCVVTLALTRWQQRRVGPRIALGVRVVAISRRLFRRRRGSLWVASAASGAHARGVLRRVVERRAVAVRRSHHHGRHAAVHVHHARWRRRTHACTHTHPTLSFRTDVTNDALT